MRSRASSNGPSTKESAAQTGRMPVLFPAYDFVSTFPYIPGDRLAITLGGDRDLDQISLDQIRRLTEKSSHAHGPRREGGSGHGRGHYRGLEGFPRKGPSTRRDQARY